jgi:YesN/AraC family two-component response regulator
MERRSKTTLEMISQKLNAWVYRREYLHTGITIIQISKILGINRTYLSNFINDTYAMNFNNWLNGLRIEEAKKRLLANKQISLSELATSVGFTDLAHFSKQFKQKEGLAPSYWLQKQQKRRSTCGK